MSNFFEFFTAGLGPAVQTITLSGILLTACAQLAYADLLARRNGLSAQDRRRLLRLIARADVYVVGALLGLAIIFIRLNHGGYDRRVAIIAMHAGFAVLLPALLYLRAVSAGLRRPALVAGMFLWALTASGLALPGLRLSGSLRPARITHTVVTLPHLPRELDGARIILVSDTHVGWRISAQNLRARLRPLRGLKGDLVVFTGDLASYYPTGVPTAAAVLGELAPRLPRVAVLGNHDRWLDPRGAVKALEANGFRTLRNHNLLLPVRGQPVRVVGVDNSYVREADTGAALAGVREGEFVLLLAHSPDVALEPEAQRADLVLCGHTHGGQVNLPLIGPIACSARLGPRYASGLHTIGRTKLFVTRGLGEVVTPFRLNCDPEIAVVELRGRS